MNFYPEDWNTFTKICPNCDKRYHESGTITCSCLPCSQCGDLIPPRRLLELDSLSYCEGCYAKGEDDDDE